VEASPNDLSRLLNERQVAAALGVSVGTVRRRRFLRQPPAWVKLGRRVLYRKQDLEAFINANIIRLRMGLIQNKEKLIARVAFKPTPRLPEYGPFNWPKEHVFEHRVVRNE